MNTRGHSNDHTTVCVGRWVWDSQGFWKWVGNCIDGWVGGPDASSRTYVHKPLSPPGSSPPTSGGTPPAGNPTPPSQGDPKPPRSGPITGPKDEEPPSEGECGNPVTVNDSIQGQSALDTETWANAPQIWQEVNVGKQLSVDSNSYDYTIPPDVRINSKGSVVKRLAGTADGVRVVAPYDMLDWQTLVGNKDDITVTPSGLTHAVYAGRTSNGVIIDGRLGLGAAHPTAARVASGWEARLTYDGNADENNPNIEWCPKNEAGTAGDSAGVASFNIKGDVTITGALTAGSQAPTASQRVTTTATLTGSAYAIFCDTDGGAFTLSLDASPDDGRTYRIINCGSNTLTIDSAGGDNIKGASSVSLLASEVLVLSYNPTEKWW